MSINLRRALEVLHGIRKLPGVEWRFGPEWGDLERILRAAAEPVETKPGEGPKTYHVGQRFLRRGTEHDIYLLAHIGAGMCALIGLADGYVWEKTATCGNGRWAAVNLPSAITESELKEMMGSGTFELLEEGP